MLRRTALALALGALLLPIAAGCGGSSNSTVTEPQPPSSTVTEPQPLTSTGSGERAPKPAPQTGVVLTRFVEASGDADTAAMWDLLSTDTKKRLGPTEAEFAKEFGPKFEQGLGAFAGTDYQLVLADEMPSGWGVAAIAGMRDLDGKTSFGTYAVALRREDGQWKIELGAPLDLIRELPKNGETAEVQPEIAIRLKAETPIDLAGLWLDGVPLPAQGQSTDLREIVLKARPDAPLSDGSHVVVVFGESGDVANAGSTPIEVNTRGASTESDTGAAA